MSRKVIVIGSTDMEEARTPDESSKVISQLFDNALDYVEKLEGEGYIEALGGFNQDQMIKMIISHVEQSHKHLDNRGMNIANKVMEFVKAIQAEKG